MYYCNLLVNLLNIKHCFFSRQGGVSVGNFASLNVSLFGTDNLQNVWQNRNIIANYFNISSNKLITARQQHGCNVLVANHNTNINNSKNIIADAIVSNTPNVAIGVVTADCLPILLADNINKVIGVVHAGWQGLLQNAITPTIQAMLKLGAVNSNIIASIGPSIDVYNYAVDKNFYNQFINYNQNYKQFFVNFNGNLHCNLQQLAIYLLQQNNVKAIGNLNLSTYTSPSHFFSHRQATHRQQATKGLQFSGIMLT